MGVGVEATTEAVKKILLAGISPEVANKMFPNPHAGVDIISRETLDSGLRIFEEEDISGVVWDRPTCDKDPEDEADRLERERISSIDWQSEFVRVSGKMRKVVITPYYSDQDPAEQGRYILNLANTPASNGYLIVGERRAKVTPPATGKVIIAGIGRSNREITVDGVDYVFIPSLENSERRLREGGIRGIIYATPPVGDGEHARANHDTWQSRLVEAAQPGVNIIPYNRDSKLKEQIGYLLNPAQKGK